MLLSAFCSAGYPYQQYVPRDYIRNPPPPSESGPPYQDPYSSHFPPERPYQAPHSGPPFSYPHPPHHDRGRHGTYAGPPPPLQPYPSQRDGMVRMSPAPLDVPPPPAGQANSLYHQEPSARDRYAPDGYCQPGTQPPQMRGYGRVSVFTVFLIVHLTVCDAVSLSKRIPVSKSDVFLCLRGHHTAVHSRAWTTCTGVGKSCCLSSRKGRSSPLHHLLPPQLFLILSPATTHLM